MKNMNSLSKSLTIIIAIVTIAGCIYAGQVEYNDAVLSAMSAEKYEYVKSSIGGGTISDVVEAYEQDREYYDSMCKK